MFRDPLLQVYYKPDFWDKKKGEWRTTDAGTWAKQNNINRKRFSENKISRRLSAKQKKLKPRY